MTHKNKAKGNGWEYRCMDILKQKGYTDITRHYGSLGVTDLEWTDKHGKHNEAQLKFSSIKQPKISKKELERIKLYAKKNPKAIIWTICKKSCKPSVWMRINP